MDSNKYLILLKNEDKTKEVLSYDHQGTIMFVKFHNGQEPYRYLIGDVVCRENPILVDLTDKFIHFQDTPLLNVERMMVFGDKAKIIFTGNQSRIYDFKFISIDDEQGLKSGIRNTFAYWTEISKHTIMAADENAVDDVEKEAFLGKEYAKINSIDPKSVLACYMSKASLTISPISNSNIIFPFKFNLSQKQALDNAMSSNISVIEGPPGTGKTQTILNIIANLVIQSKTIAVVSGNNAAVQNVKEKLVKDNYHFLAATLGNTKNREQFFSNIPTYKAPDGEFNDNTTKLEDRINIINGSIHRLMELNNRKAKAQQELSEYQLEQQHFDHYYNKQDIEEIKRLPFYRKTPQSIISFLADNHLAKEQRKSDRFLYKAKLFLKYGFRDFKSLKDNEIQVIVNLQKHYYILKIKALENKIVSMQKTLDRESFDSLLEQHEGYSTQLFRQRLHARYYSKKAIDLNSKTYKSRFNEFIDYFPVILSTTHSLRNCVPEGYLFDYVIIDESSQVDLLTGVLALSCCRNVIIVGDTKQLPQIVDKSIQDNIDATGISEAYNYFKHNILSSIMSLYNGVLPKVVLKEHYRCHPKIIHFCNQKYYDGELIAFTKEHEDDIPLVLCRTVKGNHMRKVTRGEKKGRFNQRELDVIVEEVLRSPEQYIKNYDEVGFASPYRKQVQKAMGILDSQIEADTVHKFQGREKPVIMFSTVLDHSSMGKQGIPFVDDPCIINVAVSRARDRFILITDHSLFNKHSKEVSDLIRYMEYNALDDNIIDSKIVSIFDLLYKEYSEKLISLQEGLLQVSKYKSENIMWTYINILLNEPEFKSFEVATQILLKNLLLSSNEFTNEEQQYMRNNASVDFVIYHKLNKQPVLIIEVDGFDSHENNPEQSKRDLLKNSILSKYNVPLIRFPTTGSGEKEKLRITLNELLSGIYSY